MAKTISFDDYAKGKPQIKEHRVDEDVAARGAVSLADNQNKIYEVIEETAQRAMLEIPSEEIAGYGFELEMKSAEELYDCVDAATIPRYVIYVGRPKSFAVENRYTYYLFLMIEHREHKFFDKWLDEEPPEDEDEHAEDIQFIFHTMAAKVSPENEVYFLIKEGAPAEWEHQPATERLLEKLDKNDTDAAVLRSLAERLGLPPMVLPYEIGKDFLRKNRGLIRLSEKLDGLGSLKLVVDPDVGDIAPLLVPDDYLRCGAAVRKAGKCYALYQYITQDDVLEAEDMYEIDGYYVFDVPIENTLYEPVLITTDMNQMIDILKPMWDRYSRKKFTFTVPLSGEHYMESSSPFHRFKVWGMDNNNVRVSDLSPIEKKNYDRVMDVFSKRHFSEDI